MAKTILKNLLKSAAGKIYKRFINQTKAKKIITNISIRSQINLLQLAHANIGVMKYQNAKVSGEDFLLNQLLPKLIKNTKNTILFDVGANVGDYSKLLAAQFSKAKIYSFEPNPQTHQSLKKKTAETNNIVTVPVAFGNSESITQMFTYAEDDISEHASLFENVLTDLHKARQTKKFTVSVTTIDNYCNTNKIDKIDFLKIDTEGYELQVLKGASQMIKDELIDVIQFEFNEMNIISKVFLKNFYEILTGYNFYRLDSNRLIALNDYNPINEIFLFQNIIAIKQNININI